LATDHVPVKEYLLQQQVGDETSIQTIRDLQIHHVDNRKRSQNPNYDNNYDNDDKGEMMAWGELFLLQSATCIVQSHSKYSAVAGILSEYGCKIYYDNCHDVNVKLAVHHNGTTGKQVCK
jgi:hypothetical protein